jgi:hypothetical protein
VINQNPLSTGLKTRISLSYTTISVPLLKNKVIDHIIMNSRIRRKDTILRPGLSGWKQKHTET